MANNPGTLSERFWQKVTPLGDDECWIWEANKNSAGYGMIYPGYGKNTVFAHRVAWEFWNGKIPDGLCALHKCDNPACVNPNHIFIGSKKDNYDDMVRKGRRVVNVGDRKGEKHPLARLREDDIRAIRRRAATGEKARLIGADFGISPCMVTMIKNKKRWGHVQD